MLIDSHCHLCYEVIKNDLKNVIKECYDNNIKILVNVGFNLENNICVLNIANEISNVKILRSLGFHPVEVAKKEFKKEYNQFLKILMENVDKITFIGEFGLDYHWIKNENLKTLQKTIFLEISKIAYEYKKPLVLHIRDAWRDVPSLIDKIDYEKIIFHCYTGNKKITKKLLDYEDIYFSIATSIIRNKSFLNVVKIIPIDRVLCETDSPYLHPFKKFPNTPVNVKYVYNILCELFQECVEDQIFKNFKKIVDKND